MKLSFAAVVALLGLASATAALPRENDLLTCTYASGTEMPPTVCAELRSAHEWQTARTAYRQRLIDESAAEHAALRAASAASDATALARRQELDRRLADHLLETEEKLAALRVRQEALARREARAAAAREARIDAMRLECGRDFQSPRVGMAFDRAGRCMGNLRLVSEQPSGAGVASTYRAGPLLLTFRDGAVVSWSDRRGR